MKIWIAGAAGQLGCALNDMAPIHQADAEILNTDIEEVDVTDLNQVLKFALEEKPVHIACVRLFVAQGAAILFASAVDSEVFPANGELLPLQQGIICLLCQ